MENLKFGVFSGIETNLELKFDAQCAVVESFLRDSALSDGLRPDKVPSLVTTVAHRNDWSIDESNVRGGEVKGPGRGMYRAVIVDEPDTETCHVVIAAFH